MQRILGILLYYRGLQTMWMSYVLYGGTENYPSRELSFKKSYSFLANFKLGLIITLIKFCRVHVF